MANDTIGIQDNVSIRLIPLSEQQRPRCGTCFARLGQYCTKYGNAVTEYQPACDAYDEEISIPV